MEKIYLVITIDCECDKSLNWKSSNPLSFTSIIDGIPNILQPLFDKYKAIPTYLLSNEVLEDSKSVEILGKLKGNYEYGTQLHADYIEPNKRYDKYAGTLTIDFQKDYPPEIEKAKINNLTILFEKVLGYKPRSFRAGRFGMSDYTLSILNDLGYWVDSSISPYLVWENGVSTISYINSDVTPYRPTYMLNGSIVASKIIEVPVTISITNFGYAFIKQILPFFPINIKNMAHKIVGKLLCKWLRPSLSSTEEMIIISENIINKSKENIIVLNMMFHSMEIMPGKSPYAKDEKDQMRILNRIENYLRYCHYRGIQFSTLSNISSII